MLNPCASVRFFPYKCQQGVFHHFGTELPSNTIFGGTIQSCAKKKRLLWLFHPPLSSLLELGEVLCGEHVDQQRHPSHLGSIPWAAASPRNLRNISGQGVENGFLAIHQLHLQTRLLFLAQGTARRAHPPINWGKMLRPPGDVSTTSPN